ncbi:MAG: hypothetical protein N2558_04805 [Patescibacteria group bacterium]|nr:hypothetical protein [Patescibacteria group bacterium]
MLNFEVIEENFKNNKYKFSVAFGKAKTNNQTEQQARNLLKNDLINASKNIENINNINLNEVWSLVNSYLYRESDLKKVYILYVKIINNMIQKDNNLGRAFVEES